ncbi:hypothetical protein [Bythopirellula polymerisocia]|uniref:Uncharacterized protein n=1 Tax=Bythopirellula polymerisocia TaxID=2528003 RepID=A0A5C6D359_9BACT|nr:hypothetical protein [Bythopirellula polymerisocia]TWU30211.1 hypothetical protein Pla144_09970 [Bythopirellula polymerisocia]
MVKLQKQKLVRLSETASQIWNGDLLLFRGSGLIARLIGTAGRSPYTHAARAIWWGDTLFCCEVRELKGGRAVTLASQVRKFPGRIDVFATNPDNRWAEYDRHGAIQHMLQLTGCDYGYAGLLEAALLHVPLWRILVRPATDDAEVTRRPPFCSEACAMADRIGGRVDPVPHLADRITEPADLARSSFYRYRFTLEGV